MFSIHLLSLSFLTYDDGEYVELINSGFGLGSNEFFVGIDFKSGGRAYFKRR